MLFKNWIAGHLINHIYKNFTITDQINTDNSIKISVRGNKNLIKATKSYIKKYS